MATRTSSPTIAVATTATGNIYLSPSMLVVMPVDQAWLGIRELHFASIGDGGYPYVTDAGKMLPDDARNVYSSAVAGVLAQLGAVSPRAADSMLGSLSSFADLNGGFDGLEGISMSAMLSASRLGDPTPAMQYNQWLVSGLGAPAKSGGGYASSPILDPGTAAVGFAPTASVTQTFQNPPDAITGLIRDFEGLVAKGAAALLELLGVSPDTAKSVAGTVGKTVTDAAIGAGIGALFGPGGAVAGGILGGLVGLFSSLFNSSTPDTPASGTHPSGAVSQETLRGVFKEIFGAQSGVADGSLVVVQGDVPIEKDGGPLVVNTDGGTQPAPPDARRKPPPPPDEPGGKDPPIITPSPDSCPVGDDDTITGFTVPFWGPDPILMASASPIGPGVDALTSSVALPDGSTAIQLAALPSLDETGVLLSGGATLGLVEAELRQAEQIAPGLAVGGDTWSGLEAQLHGAQPRHAAAVEPAQLVHTLRVHGFTPEDPVSSVLSALNRRYGP